MPERSDDPGPGSVPEPHPQSPVGVQPSSDGDELAARGSSTWLRQPVGRVGCALAWVVATLLFTAMVFVWHGKVAVGDGPQLDTPAVAMAHGELRCGFVQSQAPPLYELVAAAYASALDLGGSTRFPAPSGDKPVDCQRLSEAIDAWQIDTGVQNQILGAGFVVWPVLLAGFVALLRASRVGRSRLEVVGVCLLGVAPEVSFCLNEHFHPDELLALGFCLVGLAFALTDRWLLAGLAIGLGLASHQVAVLALLVLLVLGPRATKGRFVAGVVVATLVICLPVLVLSHGEALRGMLFTGTGPSNSTLLTTVFGDLSGAPRLFLARLIPLAPAVLFALVRRARLGDRVMRPDVVVQVLAFAVMMRLLFDVAFYGYYLAWAAVTLLALDLCRGRLRLATIAWIMGATLLYPTLPLVDAFSQVHPVLAQAAVVLTGLALTLWPVQAPTGPMLTTAVSPAAPATSP